MGDQLKTSLSHQRVFIVRATEGKEIMEGRSQAFVESAGTLPFYLNPTGGKREIERMCTLFLFCFCF